MRMLPTLTPLWLACALASVPSPAQHLSPHTLNQPAATPLRTVRDPLDHLTFQIPAGWTLATRDHEISSFHQEARTAPPAARLRFVAAIPENPYPASTFSGAHFYVSVTPSQTAVQCRAQAGRANQAPAEQVLPAPTVADRPAAYGHDEHGAICTQFRDDIYTLRRNGACLRFDLAMNNFCGGVVSGVSDMTHAEILDIRRQLETILQTVRFDR